MAKLLFALAVATLGALAPPSAARLYQRDAGRVEGGVEVAFILFDADASFDELDPVVLFGLAAGVHVARDWRLGLDVRFTVSDPEAEHVEVLGDLTWAWVDEPRFYDPPALRVGVSLELGWQLTELHGSDFVVTNHGFLASLAVEVGVVLFENLSLSLQLAGVAGDASNAALDDWAPSARAGVCLATLL